MSKQVIEALSKIVGVSVSDLTSAIESESSDLTFDVSKTFSNSEWKTFETNRQTEKDTEYNNGKEVGVRQFVQASKKEIGLDYEGKDSKMFLEKYKEKVIGDIGDNPDERVTTLTKDLGILRETSVRDLEAETKKYNAINDKYNSLKNGNEISGYAPNKPKGMDMSDAVMLMENVLSFQTDEDGNKVVIRDGQILKDKTRNPVKWDAAVKDYWIEKDWTSSTPDGGRGGGDKPNHSDPAKFTKQSELTAHFEEKGINPLSLEARAMTNEAGKANADFDFMN